MRITGSGIRNQPFPGSCLILDNRPEELVPRNGAIFVFINMKIIFDYNRTIFDPETDKLFPGVLDLLRELSKKNELFLVSRNEPERKKRLKELDIGGFFRRVLFVGEKSMDVFREIAGDARDVIVVGDSIGDEIKIGNQLGFITVRLKRGRFAGEIPKSADEAPKFEISEINELENIISTYGK